MIASGFTQELDSVFITLVRMQNADPEPLPAQQERLAVAVESVQRMRDCLELAESALHSALCALDGLKENAQ